MKNKAGLIAVLVALLSIGFYMTIKHAKQIDQKNDTRYVRYEAHSKEAKKHLEAMERAMRIMRSMSCDNPLSWYYQSAIHWIPDTINNNKFCGSYNNVSQIKDGWDNCTHSPSGKEKLHFLIWHRLYIWHFEKIVRKLSGYDEFALPYWGYTNQNTAYKTLPEIFRDEKSSLYEPCRFDSLNNGYPISGEINRSLDLNKLFSYTDYHLFSNNINAAPHGAMHDYIGAGNDVTGNLRFENEITGTVTSTGLMGWVPTAAFDPIFWLHHSNIDRLWQQWTNSPNGKAVMLAELKDSPWPYVFFDENGKRVEYTIEQALDIVYGEMDYDFDDTKVIPKELNTLVKLDKKLVIAKTAVPISINSQITDAVTQVIRKPSTGKSLVVEITISYDKKPKGVYELYLNKSDKGNFDNTNGGFVGFMNFFGSDHKMQGDLCNKGCCQETINKRPVTKFIFEIPYAESFNFTVYKHNGKHSANIKLEKIIVKQ